MKPTSFTDHWAQLCNIKEANIYEQTGREIISISMTSRGLSERGQRHGDQIIEVSNTDVRVKRRPEKIAFMCSYLPNGPQHGENDRQMNI